MQIKPAIKDTYARGASRPYDRRDSQLYRQRPVLKKAFSSNLPSVKTKNDIANSLAFNRLTVAQNYALPANTRYSTEILFSSTLKKEMMTLQELEFDLLKYQDNVARACAISVLFFSSGTLSIDYIDGYVVIAPTLGWALFFVSMVFLLMSFLRR